jgi:hypothetical protein
VLYLRRRSPGPHPHAHAGRAPVNARCRVSGSSRVTCASRHAATTGAAPRLDARTTHMPHAACLHASAETGSARLGRMRLRRGGRAHMPSATPAPSNWCTSWRSGAPPPAGVNTSSSLPGALISRSVARYWSPNACLRARARRTQRQLGACWTSCWAPQRKSPLCEVLGAEQGPACACTRARAARGAEPGRRAQGLPSQGQVLTEDQASHVLAAAAGRAAGTLFHCVVLAVNRPPVSRSTLLVSGSCLTGCAATGLWVTPIGVCYGSGCRTCCTTRRFDKVCTEANGTA